MNIHFHIKYVKIILALCSIWVLAIAWLSIEFYVRPRTVRNYDVMCHADRIIDREKRVGISGDGNDTTTSNIFRRITVFDDQNEILFLYGKLLQLGHRFNRRNIEAFRQEIYQELGTNISKLFYLTKENSPIGRKLRYFVTSKRFFNVSSTIYEKLPQYSTFDRINRCSVVGNSGSLLYSNCGRHIDNADFVYRCNAAPLEPFTVDAGNKSNITSFNPSLFGKRYHGISKAAYLRKFMLDMTQYNGYLWGACLSYDTFAKVCTKAMMNYNITENNFVLGHPDHFKYYANFWKKRGCKGRPSTGFYYISDALSRCNEIHLYGFWPFPLKFENSSLHNLSYHYFDDVPFAGIKKKSAHAMDIEFSFLVQLHTFGIVKLHNGKCESEEEFRNEMR